MTMTELTDGPSGPVGLAIAVDVRADGFGAGAARIWRRLAGAGVVALFALAFGVLATGQDGTDRDSGWWALVVAATTYVGALLSWWVAGAVRGAALVARHAWAGTALGLALAVALTVFFSDGVGYIVVFALVGMPAGALVGAVAACAGLVVPRRVAPVVAVLGVVAVVLLVWLTFRPTAPYDLFAVDATEQVVAAGGAEGLAHRTQEAVERAASGGDLTPAPVWESAGTSVSADLSPAIPHLRFTPVEALPTSKVTGERVRLITVSVRGERSSCVVVDPGAARVVNGACEDLDLVR